MASVPAHEQRPSNSSSAPKQVSFAFSSASSYLVRHKQVVVPRCSPWEVYLCLPETWQCFRPALGFAKTGFGSLLCDLGHIIANAAPCCCSWHTCNIVLLSQCIVRVPCIEAVG